MATPSDLAARGRSPAQRITDLTRERDRVLHELTETKSLLGRIRNVVFDTRDGLAGFTEIRELLAANWDTATPPGRSFDLVRMYDASKVSGDGRVAEGFEFENGKVALCWLGPYSSVNVYDSIDHVRHIHGHGGSTEVVFRNRTQEDRP